MAVKNFTHKPFWAFGLSPAVLVACCVGALAVQASVLLVMGQPAICGCGAIRLWTGDVSGPENSQQFGDWYTFTHVLQGFVFYALLKLAFPRWPLGLRLLASVSVEAGWEVLENSPTIIERYRQTNIAQGYFGGSVLNSIGDNLAAMTGFGLAWKLPLVASLTLFAAIEILLAIGIKDNLTLNLINLIAPGAFTL